MKNEKINSILFVCTVPTEKSGIPNVIFNLLSHLKDDSLRFGYVAINQPSEFFSNKLKESNTTLHIVPRKLSAPFSYILNLAKVAKNYDVMHVHGNSATMVLEMIAAKLAGVRFRIAHSHNTTCNMKTIDRLARPLFHALCNGRIACGREAGRWLFGNRDFKVLNNGIDTSRFRFVKADRESMRRQLRVNAETVIGHIGNFVEQKNHRFLIDIFATYHSKNPESKLLLLGDGPLKEEIISKVNELELSDSIIFAGSVDKPEKFMNAMDLVVMPSLYEGLPLTLVEEQANGLTVLAADTITSDSDMSGLVNFASLSQSPEEWEERMSQMLENARHDEEVSALAVKSIKVAKYDINVVCEDLKSYYKDLTKDD